MQRSRWRTELGARLALAVVVLLDLGARFGGELLSLGLASTSLAIGVGLLDVTQWLVFVVAVAVFAPRFFPPPVRDLAETLSVRLVVALASVGLAIAFVGVPSRFVFPLFGMILLGSGVALLVVFQWQDVSLFDEDGPVVAGLDWISGDDGAIRRELARAQSYDGWRRPLAVGTFGVAALVPFVLPTFAAGLVVATLATTFPLPDLLVLAYVAGRVVAPHLERVSDPPDVLAVDEYLLVVVRHATGSLQGAALVFLLGVGILGTGLPLVQLPALATALAGILAVGRSPLVVWNAAGVVCLYVGGLLYGLWFWIRIVPRISAFLERWTDAPRRTSLTSRPRSLTLPAFVATVLGAVGFAHGLVGWGRYAFALAWPVTLAALAWVVRATRRRHPTTTRYEDLAVLAAVLLSSLTTLTAPAILRGTLGDAFDPLDGLALAFVAFAGGFARVKRYADHHDWRYGECDDERRFALAVYVCLGGLFGLLASGYLQRGRWFAASFSLGLVVAGVVMGVMRHYRGDPTGR